MGGQMTLPVALPPDCLDYVLKVQSAALALGESMKTSLLSTLMAMLSCVLVTVVTCSHAYAKGLQSDSVYFGSSTIGAMVVADFNKDGHPDILIVDGAGGT